VDLISRNRSRRRARKGKQIAKMADNAEQLVSMAREAFVDLTPPEAFFLRLNAQDAVPNYCIGPEQNNDPAIADQWGPKRTIRADCIRWLCVTEEARPLITGNKLCAMGAKIEGALRLDHLTITFVVAFRCCSFTGKISFEGTSLRSLEFWGSHVKSIYAAGMKVSGSVHFWNGSVAVGQVNLDGTDISGDLRCDSSRFIFKHRPDDIQFQDNPQEAFRASGLQVRGFVSFNGTDVRGAVCLYQARIGGNLLCDGSRFINKSRYALLATGAKISGAVFFSRGFFAIGQVNLQFAEIGGHLECENSFFLHCPGVEDRDAQTPALTVECANITGSVLLRNGFLAIGKVYLLGAAIGSNIDCGGGHFLNRGGHALVFDNAHISSNVFLRNGFFANGEVRLSAANIGGNLECRGGQFINFPGNALNAEGADVSGDLVLSNDRAGRPFVARGQLIMRRLKVSGALHMVDSAKPEKITALDIRFATVTTIGHALNSWPRGSTLLLDGLVYGSLGTEFPADWKQCIEWLRLQPIHPRALQPYEQLAKVLKSSGYEFEATEVLIAKQDDLCRYGDLRWGARAWKHVLRFAIGYGYKPHFAFFLMIYFVVLGAGVFRDGHRNHLFTSSNEVKNEIKAKTSDPKFEPFIYSLDCFLPFIDLKQKNAWSPSANKGYEIVWYGLRVRWGGLLRTYVCVHTLLGWALTTLWVEWREDKAHLG
jgi:hypothetical protein